MKFTVFQLEKGEASRPYSDEEAAAFRAAIEDSLPSVTVTIDDQALFSGAETVVAKVEPVAKERLSVCVVRYRLPCGKKMVWKESLGSDEAKALAKRLKAGGMKAKVMKLSLSPAVLMEAARG